LDNQKKVQWVILIAHKNLFSDYSHDMAILSPYLYVHGTYKVIFIKAFTKNDEKLMSLINKVSLVIQTSNAMRFNDNHASPEPTYKGGALTGKSRIPSCIS